MYGINSSSNEGYRKLAQNIDEHLKISTDLRPSTYYKSAAENKIQLLKILLFIQYPPFYQHNSVVRDLNCPRFNYPTIYDSKGSNCFIAMQPGKAPPGLVRRSNCRQYKHNQGARSRDPTVIHVFISSSMQLKGGIEFASRLSS